MFRQFLAQLYVITTALDDSYQRDENWNLKIETDKYVFVGDLLEDVHVLRDTAKSDPKNYSGWPQEVAEPVKPQEVKRPTRPSEVAQPGRQPTEVIKPTAPETVEEPIMPNEIVAPGAAPSPVRMTAAERAIVLALYEGEISKRDETSQDKIIKRTTTVSKSIQDFDKHHVRFLNGNTVIFECEIVDGGRLVFPQGTPVKASTEEFTYSFSCWRDVDGNEVVEAPVYSDMDIYASFALERRSYPITWVVNGVSTTESVEYGTVPEFHGSTDKPMDERRIYTFIGWDDVPVRVTGEATYTAQYAEDARLYNVMWNIDGTVVSEQYKYAELPVYKGRVDKNSDDTYVYTFEGWSPGISPVTGDILYEAVYSQKNLVLDTMGSPLSAIVENATYVVKTDGNSVDVTFLYEQALKKEYGITVQFKDCVLKLSALTVSNLSTYGITRLAASADENGARFLMCDATGAAIDGGDPVILEYNYSDGTGAMVVGLVNGREEPVYIEDNKIVLLIASGQNFNIIKRYTASVTPSEFGSFTVSQKQAEAGTEIQLKQEMLRRGYVIKQISVTACLSGEPVDFNAETMTFIMPVGGANVDVVYERQTFCVRFISEGKIISEKTYYLDDEVEIPENPTKDPIDKYSYTFVGWSPEVVLVNGDAEYTAIFTQHKIADESEISEHGFENREYEWLIIFGVAIVIITGGCLAIARIKKSKKKRTSNTK